MRLALIVVMLALSTTGARAHNKSLFDYRSMMSTSVTAGIGPGANSKKVKGARNPSAGDEQNHLTR